MTTKTEALVLHGDSKELLKTVPDNSIDSLVTDPPYEYEFMNARWDGTGIAFDVGLWKEVFRVLKPGAWGVIFGADRRIHRVACAVEDAGFLLRHQGTWVSAQVFPKSLDAEKAILAKLGAGEVLTAAEWKGWGTALKTMEPWLLVRKPMEGTLAENLVKYGVGALNIDATRLPIDVLAGRPQRASTGTHERYGIYGAGGGSFAVDDTRDGRWPSVMICSDLDIEGPLLGVEVFGAEDDDLDGVLGPYTKHFRIGGHPVLAVQDELLNSIIPSCVVCPKVGPAERELGSESVPEQWVDPSREEDGAGRNSPRAGAGRKAKRRNIHPTVKPISLIRHLIRLVTPRGGTVLDIFTGSGSGGMSAVWEGCNFLGMELTETTEQPFVTIARSRIDYALKTTPPPIEARVVKPSPPSPQTSFQF
jgi:DNA modification methylase